MEKPEITFQHMFHLYDSQVLGESDLVSFGLLENYKKNEKWKTDEGV